MANLFRYHTTASANLPAFLQSEEAYKGTFKLGGSFVKSSMHAANQSGKLTDGFAKALCRAAMIEQQGTTSTDGYGHCSGSNIYMATWTDSTVFTGDNPGIGPKALIAYNATRRAFLAEMDGSPLDLAKFNSTAPFFFTVWQWLRSQPEFEAEFCEFAKAWNGGNPTSPDMDQEQLARAIRMADYAYYSFAGSSPAFAVDKPDTPPSLLTATVRGSEKYTPDEYYGNMEAFNIKGKVAGKKKKRKLPAGAELNGAYKLSDRAFTAEEKLLIPVLDDSYVVTPECVTIAEHISAKVAKPFRNILMRGEPGTGKTEMAKSVAAMLGVPYVYLTCNANTEIYDVLGQMMPTGTSKEQGPSLIDMEMDPVYAYGRITGENKPDATSEDCLKAAYLKPAEKKNAFEYVESPLIKAIRNGWVCEIQEPSLISNPGVLPGLNALLDNTRQVTLPTGEVITRNPDTVIISTTNVDCEGCRSMNQSFVDRHQLKVNIELPDDKALEERIRAMTQCDDTVDLPRMLDVMHQMREVMKKRCIEDGTVGVRAIADWVESYQITGDYVESAEMTIIPAATADPDSSSELLTVVQNKF